MFEPTALCVKRLALFFPVIIYSLLRNKLALALIGYRV